MIYCPLRWRKVEGGIGGWRGVEGGGLGWRGVEGGRGGGEALPVARHAKRGLAWVQAALHSFQGLFGVGVAADQAGFGQSG